MTTRHLASALGLLIGFASSANSAAILPSPQNIYAFLDIQPTGGRTEPGAFAVSGAGNGSNGVDLGATIVTSNRGDNFTISIDDTAPDGSDVGNIDWRDRGNGSSTPLVATAEDFIKNNLGMIRVTLSGLPGGWGTASSFHVDPDFTQAENIQVLLTDATGTAVNQGVMGNELLSGSLGSLTEATVAATGATVTFYSNGVDPIILYYDARGGSDTEVPLSGLVLTIPEPSRALLLLGGFAAIALRRRR